MEFWSRLEQDSEKAALNVAAQVGTSDYSELQDSGKPVPQVPEIQGFLQNKKRLAMEGKTFKK